jgi:serine/threonine-protein phosphatase 2A regulatory subunit A
LSTALSPDTVKELIVPAVLQLTKDPIPNIRFNAAKCLEVIIPILKKSANHPTVTEVIKPALSKMTEDNDQDVRYFGQRALVLCS